MRGTAQRVFVAIALAVSALSQTGNVVLACPNCKEAVSLGADEVANMSSGYNWSVLFMLAVPFSMLGTGAFMVHRAVKRGQIPDM
jgi:hypothetical protein